MIIKGGNLLNRIFTLVIYITDKKGVVNIGWLSRLCQVLVGKFPYLFLLSLFFYFFVSQISPGYALNRYFSLVAKYKIS